MRAFVNPSVKKKNNQREALSHEFWRKRSEDQIDWAVDINGNFLSIQDAEEIYISTHFLGEFGFYGMDDPEIRRCFELRLVTNDGRVLLRRSHELMDQANKYNTMTKKYMHAVFYPNWTKTSHVVYTKADGSTFTCDSIWRGGEIAQYFPVTNNKNLVGTVYRNGSNVGKSRLKFGGATRYPIMYASSNGKSFSIKPKFENDSTALSKMTDKLCGMIFFVGLFAQLRKKKGFESVLNGQHLEFMYVCDGEEMPAITRHFFDQTHRRVRLHLPDNVKCNSELLDMYIHASMSYLANVIPSFEGNNRKFFATKHDDFQWINTGSMPLYAWESSMRDK